MKKVKYVRIEEDIHRNLKAVAKKKGQKIGWLASEWIRSGLRAQAEFDKLQEVSK